MALTQVARAPSYGAAFADFRVTLPAAAGWLRKKDPLIPLVAECLGTLVLVFTVGCAVASPAPGLWAATSIASVLMVMIYATGPISGGNLNPAVSLALALSGKMEWYKMLCYWLAQLGGGALGAVLYRVVCDPHMVTVSAVKPYGMIQAGTVEILYTAMLCFVVLNCAASRKNNPKGDPNQFFALAIGFVIVAGGYAVGAISGAAFNPAVALGLSISSGKQISMGFVWAVFELVGALLGAALFRVLRSEEFQEPPASDQALANFKPELRIRCVAEMVGTFMLVATVGLNILTGSRSTAFSAAAALMCMIYSLGNISGAHFNPAVTLAVLFSGRGRCHFWEALFYMGSQILGSAMAAAFCATFQSEESKAIKLVPGKSFSLAQASVAECVATMVLAYVVLAVATVRVPQTWKTKQNAVFGLAIGACVTAGGFGVGTVSGGELNPAVAFGLFSASQLTGSGSPVETLVALMGAELLGGALASGFFRLTHPLEYREPVIQPKGDAEAPPVR